MQEFLEEDSFQTHKKIIRKHRPTMKIDGVAKSHRRQGNAVCLVGS